MYSLDLSKLFGRTAPAQVDLGCGDGSFLARLADLYPTKNFLGIERLAYRAAQASRKAAHVQNMRVLRMDTFHSLELLLPPQSIEAFYLLFPDPWPKRRHHRRRIVTTHFLNSIHRALDANGTLRIATDHLDYFQHIQRLVHISTALPGGLDGLKPSNFGRFEMVDPGEINLPPTKFEMRFRAQNLPIYRLSLRKISPVR
jgi:tRNA (guanine-N7-)-methyltransferase